MTVHLPIVNKNKQQHYEIKSAQSR